MSAIVDIEPTHKVEGFLLKKSSRGKWQARFFFTQSHYIMYVARSGRRLCYCAGWPVRSPLPAGPSSLPCPPLPALALAHRYAAKKGGTPLGGIDVTGIETTIQLEGGVLKVEGATSDDLGEADARLLGTFELKSAKRAKASRPTAEQWQTALLEMQHHEQIHRA